MERKLLLKVYPDSRPVSKELESYVRSLSELTPKLAVEVVQQTTSEADPPCVRICRENGEETGLSFHGVPGGHEFTSFVLGLYNAAGPGQPLSEDVKERIGRIKQPVTLKIMVTLSCNMCPDLVKAAQRIAAESSFVTAEVYDLRHFEALQKEYHIMSVPCMILNHEPPVFGKKTIEEILTMIMSAE
jgi:thioredoxin reductase (NADPH)